jgi:4-hydroxy-3-methylbut-2-enyl diphosphate reductase
MEIGLSSGIPAHLIDGADELLHTLVSALQHRADHRRRKRPEIVVQECLAWLEREFAAEVEQVTLREEHVHFAMPKELASLKPVVL